MGTTPITPICLPAVLTNPAPPVVGWQVRDPVADLDSCQDTALATLLGLTLAQLRLIDGQGGGGFAAAQSWVAARDPWQRLELREASSSYRVPGVEVAPLAAAVVHLERGPKHLVVVRTSDGSLYHDPHLTPLPTTYRTVALAVLVTYPGGTL